MFTGIIEELGIVKNVSKKEGNLHIEVQAKMTNELKVDQSVAHNGVCLTVVEIKGEVYRVTAVEETLKKTTMGELKVGEKVNLERGMLLNARLDGHIVQGHVDQTGTCVDVEEKEGSHIFTFEYDEGTGNVTIEKGSITVNGVSLTVVNSKKNRFSVAIIPYTYLHTTFQDLRRGDKVNLEFDVLGKYVKRLMELRND